MVHGKGVMIKAIIFDFGSVLYKNGWEKIIPEFKEKFGVNIGIEGEGKEKLRELYFLSNVSGIDFEKFFLECGVTDLKNAMPFYKEIYAKNRILNDSLVSFIDFLKRKYFVFGYTDIQKIHHEANEESNFNSRFKKVFTSFDFRSLKSERSSFEKLKTELKKFSLKPEDCLFIDDREINVENAKSIGFNVIHYPDFPKTEKLKEEISLLLGERL